VGLLCQLFCAVLPVCNPYFRDEFRILGLCIGTFLEIKCRPAVERLDHDLFPAFPGKKDERRFPAALPDLL